MSYLGKTFWHVWRKNATSKRAENIPLPSGSNRSSGQHLLLAEKYFSLFILFFFFPSVIGEPWGSLWQEVLPCCPSSFYKSKLLMLIMHSCSSFGYSVCIWLASCLFFSHILQTKLVLLLLHFVERSCSVFELFVINFWDSVTFVNQEGEGFEVDRKN